MERNKKKKRKEKSDWKGFTRLQIYWLPRIFSIDCYEHLLSLIEPRVVNLRKINCRKMDVQRSSRREKLKGMDLERKPRTFIISSVKRKKEEHFRYPVQAKASKFRKITL